MLEKCAEIAKTNQLLSVCVRAKLKGAIFSCTSSPKDVKVGKDLLPQLLSNLLSYQVELVPM